MEQAAVTKVDLFYVGQSLTVWPDANHTMTAECTRIKHDGTGSYVHHTAWSDATNELIGRGHGGSTWTIVPDPLQANRFLYYFNGYHIMGTNTNPADGSGDYYAVSGLGTIQWDGTGNNPFIRLGSWAGEVGGLVLHAYRMIG